MTIIYHKGENFSFDCVVVVGGGSEGEVTQVEVVEVGGGRENLANLDKNMYHSIFPVAIYVLKKADQAETLTISYCYFVIFINSTIKAHL